MGCAFGYSQLFRRMIVLPSSLSLDPEDEGNTILRNVGKYLANDTE